ncbi:MAG: hypothetical protein JWN93_999, partial [Hyphomicrobiales bacterium]|nr:hypothetical protein [Hyphomicrobiales bacterium]
MLIAIALLPLREKGPLRQQGSDEGSRHQYGFTLPTTVVRSISRRSCAGKSSRAWLEHLLSHSS